MDSAPDYGSGGWGFESLQVHESKMQLIENEYFNGVRFSFQETILFLAVVLLISGIVKITFLYELLIILIVLQNATQQILTLQQPRIYFGS